MGFFNAVVLVRIALAVFTLHYGTSAVVHTTHRMHINPPTTADPLLTEIANLKQTVEGMARQMMMQQLFVEERIRSDGVSGLKQIRHNHHGTKSYFSEAHSNGHVGGIHDIPYASRRLYMGDNTYVMNGVEFRTHVNNYYLHMPNTKNKTLHSVEDIPFPDVPPSVLSKRNITDQIHEMSEYFRAFKHQDKKIRSDYTKYFKPVICYIEGSWLDLSTTLYNNWLNVDKTTKFWTNGGGGTLKPDYVPVTIMKVVNDKPYYAHWHHRTLCHPIKRELHLSDFYAVDDLAPRFAKKKSFYDFSKSGEARFKLARNHGHGFNADVGYAIENPASSGYTTLDKIMEEIPGKDNYQADLNDGSFGLTEYNAAYRNFTTLNTGYYHRWYKVSKKGAMGTTVINRGYTDHYLFTAQNTQSKVAPMSYNDCHKNRTVHHEVCVENVARYSYAIPLEIIWLTPLLKWNPYNFEIYPGNYRKSPANIVTAHGRNGGRNTTKAFNGVNENNYYLTPIEFYDKHSYVRGVLDRHGDMKVVMPAGTWTVMPNIKEVGPVRLRYPIVPLHQEGNAVYKQLDALKEIIMNMAHNARIFENAPPGLYVDGQLIGSSVVQTHYVTSHSTSLNPPSHLHDVYIDAETMDKLRNHTTVYLYTSLNEGHMHMLTVDDVPHHSSTLNIRKCDGLNTCFDGHTHSLYKQRY